MSSSYPTQAETIASRSPRPSPALTVVSWILQLLGAGLFLYFGTGKIIGNPNNIATFEQVGLGQWFRVFVGSLEVLGAIGLLIPLFAGLAAACLSLLMIGAMSVELFVVNDGNVTTPLICFVIAVAVAVLRRRTLLRPYFLVRERLTR